MKMSPLYATALCVLLTAAGPGRAFAHAFLDHAEPRVGSQGPGPAEVKVWFTEEIEPAFSGVRVLDAGGNEVDGKDARVDPNDKTLLVVSLPRVPPGTYKVVWHVVSADTHRTQGEFRFVVKP